MDLTRFRQRAVEAAKYCRENGYNQRIVLLWDLSIHSGRRRFVVWNIPENREEHAFLASHGSGSRRSHVPSAYARVSNADGSHLSSVGRALVAERYVGRYGVAYRLDGLEETNSAMRRRCIVLHSWRYTTSFPVWPLPTIGSWGCPVLSQRDMKILDKILQQEQSVVLWAYK